MQDLRKLGRERIKDDVESIDSNHSHSSKREETCNRIKDMFKELESVKSRNAILEKSLRDLGVVSLGILQFI